VPFNQGGTTRQGGGGGARPDPTDRWWVSGARVGGAWTGEDGALMRGPRSHSASDGEIWFQFKFQLDSNCIQIHSHFDRSKKDIFELENFELKYSCEGFEERNNFLYKNFFRFEMGFELKFMEVKVYFWL
jgi:hypothetical protein